jgi:phosphopantothenoylcysteine decarboxylase/phosphopantothenate--cysteine ligase, prokaryotic
VSSDIKCSLGNTLYDKNIVHCLTGSVSVYKAIDISRYLVRYGANVIPVMSEDAIHLISPDLMEYATGNKVITKITGEVEHVKVFERYRVDMILIAPSTANTISKIANGISDTNVTLIASIALGKGIPLLIAPAMHEPMYRNPILIENIKKLKSWGVHFIEPRIEEGKAKIATEDYVYYKVLDILTPKDLKGKEVVITTGSTREYIDAIRFITNPSTGKMGNALALEAKVRGANVTLLFGDIKGEIPYEIEALHCVTSEDMIKEINKIFSKRNVDFFVSAAGITDYKPSNRYKGKIETSKVNKISLELETTPKIIRYVKEISPQTKVIAFKAEYGLNEYRIKEIISEYDFVDYIIFNDVSRNDIGFESDFNEVTIAYNNKMEKIEKARKDQIAKKIWDVIAREIK